MTVRLSNANVMGMGANVLGVMDGRLELHGKPRPVRWTRLAATVNPVLEGRQLLDADGTASMHPPRRDADLGPKAELATIGELR